MWGWLDSIVNWFKSLWETTTNISSQITSLPSKIGEFVRSSFDGFVSFVSSSLKSIYHAILNIYNELPNLPSKIGEFVRSSFDGFVSFVSSSLKTIYNKIGDIFDSLKDLPENMLLKLKELFIPDTKELENIINTMVDNISNKIGIEFNTLDYLFDRESAPTDVNMDYDIAGVGSFKLKVLDSSFLIMGVQMLRPYIRAFMVLLLLLFVWKHVMQLIGQDPSIAHNAHENYQEWRAKNSK